MMPHALAIVVATFLCGADPAAMRAAAAARLEMLAEFEAKYTITITVTPTAEGIAYAEARKADGIIQTQGTSTGNCVLRRSGARIFSQRSRTGLDDRSRPYVPFKEIIVQTPERSEQLNQDPADKSALGVISASSELPELVLDLGLGLRAERDEQLMSRKQLEQLAATAPDDNTLVLTRTDANQIVHTWTYAARNGFALARYQLTAQGFPVYDVVSSDFRPVSGTTVPFTVTRRTLNPRGDVLSTDRADVSSWVIGAAAVAQETFSILWPLGAHVTDDRTGARFFIATKATALDDETILAKIDADRRASSSTNIGNWLRFFIVAALTSVLFGFLVWRLRRQRSLNSSP